MNSRRQFLRLLSGAVVRPRVAPLPSSGIPADASIFRPSEEWVDYSGNFVEIGQAFLDAQAELELRRPMAKTSDFESENSGSSPDATANPPPPRLETSLTDGRHASMLRAMGILRTWQCHNTRRCGKVFDSWDDYPSCPGCKNVKVSWVPGGGHVMSTAPGADADIRSLADTFGLTDLTSTRHGQKGGRAKPPLPATTAPAGNSAMSFGGFVSPQPYALGSDGQIHATCMPASNKIDYKVKTAPGTVLPASKNYPRPQSNTVIEARHSGK